MTRHATFAFHSLAVPTLIVTLAVVAVSMVLDPLDPPYGVLTAMAQTVRGAL